MKFKCKILETHTAEIVVEASNKHEAFEKAQSLWEQSEAKYDNDNVEHEIYVTGQVVRQ